MIQAIFSPLTLMSKMWNPIEKSPGLMQRVRVEQLVIQLLGPQIINHYYVSELANFVGSNKQWYQIVRTSYIQCSLLTKNQAQNQRTWLKIICAPNFSLHCMLF